MMPNPDTTPDNPCDARVQELRNQGVFVQHTEPYVPVPEPYTGGIDGMNGCLLGVLLGFSIR